MDICLNVYDMWFFFFIKLTNDHLTMSRTGSFQEDSKAYCASADTRRNHSRPPIYRLEMSLKLINPYHLLVYCGMGEQASVLKTTAG